MRIRSAATLIILSAVASLTCGADGANPTGPTALGSTQALIGALEQQGATVVRMEQMSRELHCLSVGALRLTVSGENVYVFEYANADATNRDVLTVSPDGGVVGTCSILWIGPPRFYKQARLIVLYVGGNPDVIRRLEAVLGAPFAGR